MKTIYPTPQEIGISPPKRLIRELFNAGFEHAMRGGNISETTHLKLSFREGFRAAKLHIREIRKEQGIQNFPLQGRILTKVA